MPSRSCWVAPRRSAVARVDASPARTRRASHADESRRHWADERATSPRDRARCLHPLGAPVVADLPLADRREPSGRLLDVRSRGNAVSGVWDRDEAAIFVEALFGRHQAEIYAYLLRMLREPELAADLTQD